VKNRFLKAGAICAAVLLTACGSRPAESTLRESFAEQLAANRFIRDFQRLGDELQFTGPGAEGGVAKWRVRVDSAVIEDNPDEAQPYKGTIKSSWYSDGQPVQPSGRDSNLPIELTDNGLSQDCWAFWDATSRRWTWE
jgi:hypothetical protein